MNLTSNTEGTYSIKVNSSSKQMDIKIAGIFTPQKADNFVKDYNRNLRFIKPSDSKLILDCHGLAISRPEMVPVLEGCIAMYKESGFQEVKILIKKNPTVKMQLNRLVRNVGLINGSVIED